MPLHEQSTLSNERYEEINTIFSHDDKAYEVLRSENQGVYGKANIWDSDFVRQRMAEDADRLVGLLDGSIPERENITDISHFKDDAPAPDVVIALDKSGRPLRDVAEAFWDTNAKEDATMPEFDFLNIDRIDWLKRMGFTEREAEESSTKKIDMSSVSDEEIARIRAYFVEGSLSEENWQEEVWQLPTRLDDKDILILDEVKNSGATLEIAAKVIQKAVPEARITGDYFWTDGTSTDINGNRQRATVPIWYDRESKWGRGVGDVNIGYFRREYEENKTQENFRNLLAAFALSAPHHNEATKEHLVDEKYIALKKDLGHLALEQSWLPHPDRDEDWDERMDELAEQTGVSVDELLAYRRMRVEKNAAAAKRVAP